MLRRRSPLLLSMWLGVIFLVPLSNFALTMGFHWSHTLLIKSLVLMHSWHWFVNLFYTFVSMKGQKVKMRSQWRYLCVSYVQGTHLQVFASTINNLTITTKRLHLTLVIEHYHINQYPHSTIVYRQQQQPINFLLSTSYGTTIQQ